jgi:uncharacterized membrane-anchored protein YitT (DUF2179 family)
MLVGTFIAAVALEYFLLPNDVMDGGIVGISIMIEHLTGLPLGALTFVLNVPFLVIGYKQIGRTFLISSLISIAFFSIWLALLPNFHFVVTNDTTLGAIFGGIILGAGVGIVIRRGGSLDGTEMVAIILARLSPISVGQCVLLFNVVIYSVAGVIFGWDKAMYSLITYFIASKVIDIVVEGIDEAKCLMIVSDKYEEVASAISDRLGRGVTFLNGEGGYSHRQLKVIYVVVTRLEIAKVKGLILQADSGAFLTISNVADVLGGSQRKKPIH